MSYYRIGPYLFSDDFDRFYDLLASGMPVIYTSSRDKGVLHTARASNIGTQHFTLNRRFHDEKWLFLDPATQYDPDRESVIRKAMTVRWGEPLISDMEIFGRAKAMMAEAVANFMR